MDCAAAQWVTSNVTSTGALNSRIKRSISGCGTCEPPAPMERITIEQRYDATGLKAFYEKLSQAA